MKKIIIALLAAALALMGLAVAEPTAPTVIENHIENGSYVIRIPVQDDGAGWVADDMFQDDSVVKLESAAVEDGVFVVRYAPVADGDMTVSICHYRGIACDTAFTWDLRVAGGQVVECTGGSLMESPEAEELEPYIAGEWVEAETGNDTLFIERGDGEAFVAQYIAPGREGATAFKATISYDCQSGHFVYADGAFHKVPITDTEEDVEGELIADNINGSFDILQGDRENELRLSWYDSLSPESTLTFVRANANSEGHKTVEPMNETVDLNDGTYPVSFSPADLNDGTLSHVHVYTEDSYDIVDISLLEVGDSIVIDGRTVEITALNHNDMGWLEINGGNADGGYDLAPVEEDNCFHVRLDDDFPTYTDHGEATLILDENVTLNDSWDIDGDPITATGVAEVEKAIRESNNEQFDVNSTTLCIEGGKVVEIIRTYVP